MSSLSAKSADFPKLLKNDETQERGYRLSWLTKGKWRKEQRPAQNVTVDTNRRGTNLVIHSFATKIEKGATRELVFPTILIFGKALVARPNT